MRDVVPLLPDGYQLEGDTEQPGFDHAGLVMDAGVHALVWVSAKRLDKRDLANSTRAGVVVCDPEVTLYEGAAGKCLVKVADPQLTFARLAQALLRRERRKSGVHPTATVDAAAVVDASAWVGPYCHLGHCKVGAGSYLDGHVSVADEVEIGKHVFIKAGARIGGEGFGPLRNERGEFEPFPHFGGVIVEDNVHIGCNVVIDRGALKDTVVREGSQINNLTLIGHNVEIGRHTLVGANCVVAGGSIVGEFTAIWNGATVFDGISVGSNVVVGAGSVVTRSVPDNTSVRGVPAREAANA